MPENIPWQKSIEEKFNNVVKKIAIFHRSIADAVVREKVQEYAGERGAAQVEEQDVVKAMFNYTPEQFFSRMKKLLDEEGIEYKKYGFGK